jgi:hypothetical protein
MCIRSSNVGKELGMTNFEQRLQAAGYSGETDRFYREVDEVFATNFAEFQTDEQLKRHPRQALRFCDMVRDQLSLPGLADDVILGAQENYRKHRERLTAGGAASSRR